MQTRGISFFFYFLISAAVCLGATWPNKFTTNQNPESVAWSNSVAIRAPVFVGSSSYSTITNAPWTTTNAANVLISRTTGRINVLDYGATPVACRTYDNAYTGAAIVASDVAVAAAIAAAYASKGESNTVYFPPGIYRFTNSAVYVPAGVNIAGGGNFFNQGYSQPNLLRGYTLLWMNNTNSQGLWFTQMTSAHSKAEDFSICGWQGGPVPYAGASGMLETTSLSEFAQVGMQVMDTNSAWCGGFDGNNVTVSGFRVGVRCDAGQSTFWNCGWAGNEVGFASLGRADFASAWIDYWGAAARGVSGYWTNALQYLTAAGYEVSWSAYALNYDPGDVVTINLANQDLRLLSNLSGLTNLAYLLILGNEYIKTVDVGANYSLTNLTGYTTPLTNITITSANSNLLTIDCNDVTTLGSNAVSSILQTLDSIGRSNGVLNFAAQQPTAAGLTARTNLVNKLWTVEVHYD